MNSGFLPTVSESAAGIQWFSDSFLPDFTLPARRDRELALILAISRGLNALIVMGFTSI